MTGRLTFESCKLEGVQIVKLGEGGYSPAFHAALRSMSMQAWFRRKQLMWLKFREKEKSVQGVY